MAIPWNVHMVFSMFCQTWSWADIWGQIVDWIELFNSSQVAFGFLSMILFLLFPGSSLLRGAFPQETNSGKVSFFLSFQLYFPTWWDFLSQSFIRKVFYAQDKTRWCHFFISRCVYGNHWQRQTWQALRKTNKAFSCFSMSMANTPLYTLRSPIHFSHFKKTFSPLDWISFGVWMLFNDRDICITNSAGKCEFFCWAVLMAKEYILFRNPHIIERGVWRHNPALLRDLLLLQDPTLRFPTLSRG